MLINSKNKIPVISISEKVINRHPFMPRAGISIVLGLFVTVVWYTFFENCIGSESILVVKNKYIKLFINHTTAFFLF